jgi:hypothetical protein
MVENTAPKITDLEELEIETFQLESLDDLGVSAPDVYTSSTSSTCCSVV